MAKRLYDLGEGFLEYAAVYIKDQNVEDHSLMAGLFTAIGAVLPAERSLKAIRYATYNPYYHTGTLLPTLWAKALDRAVPENTDAAIAQMGEALDVAALSTTAKAGVKIMLRNFSVAIPGKPKR